MAITVDIPEVFSLCVQDVGGICLDAEFPGNPGSKLADYFFEKEAVVAELKCLSEDLDPDEFHEYLRNWASRGLIPPPPEGVSFQVYTRDLPETCQREFFRRCRDRLCGATIKKANRQIRETKKKLGVPQARGLLLIANDGNSHLRPGLLRQLVIDACRKQFVSIDEAVIFTANFGVTGGDSPEGTRIWAPIPLPGRAFKREGLALKLAEPFYRRYANAAGVEMIGRERPAPSFAEVESISYEGHPVPPNRPLT